MGKNSHEPVEQLPELNLSEALAVMEEDKTELDKIFELMLSEKNIAHNTDLNQNEILAFSMLSMLARKHDLDALKMFLLENLQLRVSKGRKGRKEWVNIVSRYANTNEEDEMPGRLARMFGRR